MDTGCIPPTVNFFQYTSVRRPILHEMHLYALGGPGEWGRNLFADLLACSLYLCATGE